MSFQESIRVCLSKYADFNGTASRAEYWWFALFLLLGGAVTSAFDERYTTVFLLLMLLPLLAVGARRLHETGRSGWLQLFGLVPVGGVVIIAVFMTQEARAADVPPAPVAGEPAA